MSRDTAPMTELEHLQDIAESLHLFLREFERLHCVKLGGTSCCGCSSVTLEVMPVVEGTARRLIGVDVMEL